jgi:hypothetical protein
MVFVSYGFVLVQVQVRVRSGHCIFAVNASASVNASANAGAPTNNPRYDIHRGVRASHITHSKLSGTFYTTPCGGAPQKENWRRQAAQEALKTTHT